jgi:peptide/nickel transport system permease protein
MAAFLARRLAFLIVVLFGVTVVTFTISHVVPGDPARLIAGPRATTIQLQQLRTELGLNQPLTIQYWRYVKQIAHGDLGTSLVTGRPILTELAERLPATLELMLCALLCSLAVGIPAGVLAATRKNSGIDHMVRAGSAFGLSVPAFWLAPLLILLFYSKLGWLPGSGRLEMDAPVSVTGFLLIDTLLAGDGTAFIDAIRHLALPVLTLALLDAGAVARLVRGQMIEVLNEDYIRTALASGLPRRTVILRHALRNALIPLITVLGLSIAQMLYGSVIIESLFGWPGTGNYVVTAIFNLDFPVVMGFALLASVAYVGVNLIVDLLYMAIDPRIREVG